MSPEDPLDHAESALFETLTALDAAKKRIAELEAELADAVDYGRGRHEAEQALATVPGPRFCACGRVESDCDQSRASCPKADPASGGDDETDIIIAGRQVPFVQVGMIVHPDDCLNCERDGSLLWCSALVCDIHDDDETARFGMMATLLFRNGERREEPCDELRRRWRLARDFDQGRVYTGRWGAIPRGSVWPVAEVNEDA